MTAMYTSKYDKELGDEVNFFKRNLIWLIILAFAVAGGGWLMSGACHTAASAVNYYEEFESIYATCQQLDADIHTLRNSDPDDSQFVSFSRDAQVRAKQQQLTRWINEYNAKSRMWTRGVWKPHDLPRTLSTDDFPNYR